MYLKKNNYAHNGNENERKNSSPWNKKYSLLKNKTKEDSKSTGGDKKWVESGQEKQNKTKKRNGVNNRLTVKIPFLQTTDMDSNELQKKKKKKQNVMAGLSRRILGTKKDETMHRNGKAQKVLQKNIFIDLPGTTL